MVRVRPIDGRFAFVSLRADGWSVTGIMVQRTGDGHRITWPFVATEDEWHSACLTLEHRDACIDLMAGIGSVRLRPTPSGVGVDLTEDSAAATPTPGAALGDEGAF